MDAATEMVANKVREFGVAIKDAADAPEKMERAAGQKVKAMAVLSTFVAEVEKEKFNDEAEALGTIFVGACQTAYHTVNRFVDQGGDAAEIPTRLYKKGQTGLSAVEDSVVAAFSQYLMRLKPSKVVGHWSKLQKWARNKRNFCMADDVDKGDVSSQDAARALVLYKLFGRVCKDAEDITAKPLLPLVSKDLAYMLKSGYTQGIAMKKSKKRTAKDELKSKAAWWWWQGSQEALTGLTTCLDVHADNAPREAFDDLVEPICDFTDVAAAQTEDIVAEVTQALGDSFSQMARRAPDDAALKDLVMALMRKTRSKNAAVRLCALSTLLTGWKRLGNTLLVCLTEQLSFLAERLEDAEEKVEKVARDIIKTVEGLTGESLAEKLR